MNAISLFTREFGEPKNPIIIILHGLFGMSDNWVSLAKSLSNRFFVLVPDLRNHGNSPHTEDFSYELMLEDVLNLYTEKNISSAIILGHSMGGKLAMNLAINFPEKVDKLIIADMSLKQGEFKEIHALILETISKTDLAKFASFGEIEKWFDSFIPQKKIVLFALKNIKKNSNGSFEWKLNYFSLHNNTHKIMEPVVPFESYKKLSLFIKGELSEYIMDEDIIEIKTWFPLAEIKIIPNSSHWVHADNPKMFLELVNDFLK